MNLQELSILLAAARRLPVTPPPKRRNAYPSERGNAKRKAREAAAKAHRFQLMIEQAYRKQGTPWRDVEKLVEAQGKTWADFYASAARRALAAAEERRAAA